MIYLYVDIDMYVYVSNKSNDHFTILNYMENGFEFATHAY